MDFSQTQFPGCHQNQKQSLPLPNPPPLLASTTSRRQSVEYSWQQHHHHSLQSVPEPASLDPNPDIYEPIYDSRWRLLNQEAARLQRDRLSSSKSPTPVSSLSSRESSLGPAGSIATSSIALLNNSKPPKQLRISRSGKDFGFTLRHFIVYPPEDCDVQNGDPNLCINQPMESIFVRSIKRNGPAQASGLEVGDRILSVNGVPVEKKSYSEVVHMVQKTEDILDLVVVQKQDDILQIYFSEIAQNPETNQRPYEKPAVASQPWTQIKDPRQSRESSLGPTCVQPPSPRVFQLGATTLDREHRVSPSRQFQSSHERFSSYSSHHSASFSSLSTVPVQKYSIDHAYAVPAWVQEDEVSTRSSTSLESGSMFGADDGGMLTSHNLARHFRMTNPVWQTFQHRELSDGFVWQRRPVDPDPNFQSQSVFNSGPISLPQVPYPQRPLPPIPLRTSEPRRQTPERFIPASDHIVDREETSTSLRQTISQGRSQPRPRVPRPTNLYGLPAGYQFPLLESVDKMQKVTTAVVIQRTPEMEEKEPLYSTVVELPTGSEVSSSVVKRVNKPSNQGDRNLRRVSYLMATQETQEELIHAEEEDGQEIEQSNVDGSKTAHGGVQKLLAAFSRKVESSPPPNRNFDGSDDPEPVSSTEKGGWLDLFVNVVNGKTWDEKHWKSVYTVVKNGSIYFYKDRKAAKEGIYTYGEIPLSIVQIESSSDDSFKQRNIFKMKTQNRTEILIKADSETSLSEWLQVIDNSMATERVELRKSSSQSKNFSPPAVKSKKTVQESASSDRDAKKTWKIKVPKQWKKTQGTPPTVHATYPIGGSIGVPLELCPVCSDPGFEQIPLLVKICCSIVEERGLETIGIYRVPGNTAGVNYLTEQVNKGEAFINLEEDPRWCDVNIVSSLIKSFFRKLPEPLFTLEMYSTFIETSKIEDSILRLNSLKRLVHELPEKNFETLKFVSFHLCKVIENALINKMELRNLAIVFGPTLVRTSDDNMLSMVTDMAQQCRIIESILSNCDWFFNSDSMLNDEPGSEVIIIKELTPVTEITQTGNQSLLLTNLQKLEGSGKMVSPSRETVTAKDIVNGILSAANRKMLRAAAGPSKNKKDSMDASNARDPPPSSHDQVIKQRQSQVIMTTVESSSTQMSQRVSASRRSSESILHGAVAMAAVVPNLIDDLGNVQRYLSPLSHNSAIRQTSSLSGSLDQLATQVKKVSSQDFAVTSGFDPHYTGSPDAKAMYAKRNNNQRRSSVSLQPTQASLSVRRSSESVLPGAVAMAAAVPSLMKNTENVQHYLSVTSHLSTSIREKSVSLDRLSTNASRSSDPDNENVTFSTEFSIQCEDAKYEKRNFMSELNSANASKNVDLRRNSESVLQSRVAREIVLPNLLNQYRQSLTASNHQLSSSMSEASVSPSISLDQLSMTVTVHDSSDDGLSQDLHDETRETEVLKSVINSSNFDMRRGSEVLCRLPEEEPHVGALSEEQTHSQAYRSLDLSQTRFVSLNYGLPRRASWATTEDTSRRDESSQEQLNEKLRSNQKDISKEKKKEQDENVSPNEKLLALTTTFDEKLRLLLDPNYQTNQVLLDDSANIILRGHLNEELNQIGEPRANKVKRTSSLTKQEKQLLNIRTRGSVLGRSIVDPNTDSAVLSPATMKQLKTIANQRRIKRRHTVGGTKDVARFNSWAKNQPRQFVQKSACRSSGIAATNNPGMSSLDFIPPNQDLTNNRRFSLPEPV